MQSGKASPLFLFLSVCTAWAVLSVLPDLLAPSGEPLSGPVLVALLAVFALLLGITLYGLYVLLARPAPVADAAVTEPAVIHHPALGALSVHDSLPDMLVTGIDYEKQRVELTVHRGEGSMDEALAFAAGLVAQLPVLDAAAKGVITQDLLAGLQRDFPGLTAQNCAASFNLTGLAVTGSARVEFGYGAVGIALKQGVAVVWDCNVDFTEARARLHD
ncbi:hypothetical protein EV700_0834 [Fluviicoccus keumensis]|uniref:Uncharacterized protein n=1 Tax=Fluviicoccus keumensis TaxID=1435465 RepID=A0A4Q7ZB93_9GAMM|nr:hypothetical protein [Fluviicoccus keumensis]RZU47867.1 hypothetical protein EV700_0834 [Fluviicoccus keumensis]